MAKKLKKGDTVGDKTEKFSDAGKGDKSRVGISQKEWGERWEKIFGKKSNKK